MRLIFMKKQGLAENSSKCLSDKRPMSKQNEKNVLKEV